MNTPLEHDPLWPAALGALQAHLEAWSRPQTRRIPADWKALAAELRRLGVAASVRDALLGWAGVRLAEDGPFRSGPARNLPIRLLHPMERELLHTAAYGHLVDAYRCGLLDLGGVEQVLEECAQLTRLPATLEQARSLIRRVVAARIASGGFGRAH